MDRKKNRYTVFYNDSAETRTVFWVYDIDTGKWWPCLAGVPISAGCDVTMRFATVNPADSMLLGSYSIDTGNPEQEILRVYREGATDTKYLAATAAAHFVESDDLDFGEPVKYKRIQKVIGYFKAITASGGPDTPIISVSNDSGVTWVDKTLSIALSSNLDKQVLAQASFLDETNAHAAPFWRVKLSWAAGDQPLTVCTRLIVVAELSGSMEQVELASSA